MVEGGDQGLVRDSRRKRRPERDRRVECDLQGVVGQQLADRACTLGQVRQLGRDGGGRFGEPGEL